jgi:hypothetical protein
MAKEEQGWIKLHRASFSNAMYFSETFTRWQAWCDLLLLANHKEKWVRIRGIKVLIKRGQTGFSMPELAIRWRWSKGKVIRFLNELEIEQQIVLQKNNVTTLISITKYSSYQDSDTANEFASDTANEFASDTASSTADLYNELDNNDLQVPKNEKNEKNEKEENIGGRGGFAPPQAPPQTFAVFKALDGSLVKEMRTEFKPEDFNGLPENWLMRISDNIWSVKQFRVEPERIVTLWESFKYLEMHKKLYSNKDGVYSFFSNYCKKQAWTKPRVTIPKTTKQHRKVVGVEFINDFSQCRMSDGSIVELDRNQSDQAKFNQINPNAILAV